MVGYLDLNIADIECNSLFLKLALSMVYFVMVTASELFKLDQIPKYGTQIYKNCNNKIKIK